MSAEELIVASHGLPEDKRRQNKVKEAGAPRGSVKAPEPQPASRGSWLLLAVPLPLTNSDCLCGCAGEKLRPARGSVGETAVVSIRSL